MIEVWYCKEGHDPQAITGKGPVVCDECNKQMTKIGWMETNEEQEQE